MRILLTILLLAGTAMAQAPAAPAQGPAPKKLTRQPDGHISANADPANAEKFETHVVVAGETLSQIAGTAMKDSRLWPQLWESNEHIVNPHWIYPNDKILIRPVTKITGAAPPAASEPAPAAPVPVVAVEPPPAPVVPASRGIAVIRNLLATTPVPTPKPLDRIEIPAARSFSLIKSTDVYCSGFIRNTPASNSSKVTSTYLRNEAFLSTEGQYVRVGNGPGGEVKVGGTYQVVRPTVRVNDSSRSGAARNLGMHYLDVAQIQIVQAQADSALARVVGNCEAIEVGDLMIPFVKLDIPELPRNRSFSSAINSTGKTKGSLVLMKNNTVVSNAGAIVAEGGVVYINLGKADGLKAGDLFIVYHGKSAIGEVAVLKVDERTSSALVTYSTDAFVLGDRVEQR